MYCANICVYIIMYIMYIICVCVCIYAGYNLLHHVRYEKGQKNDVCLSLFGTLVFKCIKYILLSQGQACHSAIYDNNGITTVQSANNPSAQWPYILYIYNILVAVY